MFSGSQNKKQEASKECPHQDDLIAFYMNKICHDTIGAEEQQSGYIFDIGGS